MLYNPDDPLITWLRDGQLGGITLGSTRAEVLEKWGEPHEQPGPLWFRFSEDRRSHLLVGFERDRARLIEASFLETCPLPWPELLGTPPFALSAQTSECEFLDLMQFHQIPVRRFEYGWR